MCFMLSPSLETEKKIKIYSKFYPCPTTVSWHLMSKQLNYIFGNWNGREERMERADVHFSKVYLFWSEKVYDSK